MVTMRSRLSTPSSSPNTLSVLSPLSASPTRRMQAIERIMTQSSRAAMRTALGHLAARYHAAERQERWPTGTAQAIMAALAADTSHTFTAYDADGTRAVERIGPFVRDGQGALLSERSSAADADDERLPMVHNEQVEYTTSHADGLPSYLITTTLPDGSRYDARDRRRPTPSARALRQMVVAHAQALHETPLLEHGLGRSVAAWVAAGDAYAAAAAPVSAPMPADALYPQQPPDADAWTLPLGERVSEPARALTTTLSFAARHTSAGGL
jgi:hypothetical protein